MNAPTGYEVDHVNHVTLDNRKSNLRTVTTSENAQNKKNVRTDSTSKITGVSWNKRKNKWQCSINKDKKKIHLGYYEKIEDAEKVVKEARISPFHFSKEYTESTGIVSKNVSVPKSTTTVKFTPYKQARYSSGVCGISWKENNNRWQVRVNEDGKRKYLGVYVELEDAIQAKANYESKKK